jgi:hypothetical protein
VINTIFLFGPSCGGKSTLGKALQRSLGREWSYVDQDDFIENGLCLEEHVNAFSESRIREIGKKVIVDAKIPWRDKKPGEFYCLLLPPLNVLLQRDATRTLKLNRTVRRSRGARLHVIDTHKVLSQINQSNFDLCMDSSKISTSKEVAKIKALMKGKAQLSFACVTLAVIGLSFSLLALAHIK